jgi:hypothetical protein
MFGFLVNYIIYEDYLLFIILDSVAVGLLTVLREVLYLLRVSYPIRFWEWRGKTRVWRVWAIIYWELKVINWGAASFWRRLGPI